MFRCSRCRKPKAEHATHAPPLLRCKHSDLLTTSSTHAWGAAPFVKAPEAAPATTCWARASLRTSYAVASSSSRASSVQASPSCATVCCIHDLTYVHIRLMLLTTARRQRSRPRWPNASSRQRACDRCARSRTRLRAPAPATEINPPRRPDHWACMWPLTSLVVLIGVRVAVLNL